MEAIGWTSSRERRPFPLAWPTDDGGCRGVVGLEACSCHLWRLRLEFQRSFRATGSPAGKIRTFRARRILVSRAWLGRQRGERARRPPGGAGRRATTGTTRQAWAEASALPRHLLRVRQDRTLPLLLEDKRLNRPCEQSYQPGWLAGCCLLSSP